MDTAPKPTDRQSPKPRWYHPTPDRLLIALLPIIGLLWLSEQFRWFPFNEHKNWTVLIALAVVCMAVVLLLLWFGVSLVLRRQFQFSIRSLLVGVMVVAVACSWFSVKMQQARRQREVVGAIEMMGGYVVYYYQFDANGFFLPWPAEPPGPAWLQNLLGVDFLSYVRDLRYEQATNAELKNLKGMTSLRHLGLAGTQVTDAGLVHLEELTSLQFISLRSTQASDAGLVYLKGLTSLQMLWLFRTQVTDAGLLHLKGLTSLEELLLSNTQVTDAGLVHLEGLTSLTHLALGGTQVTDAGVQDLQKALPNCQIAH